MSDDVPWLPASPETAISIRTTRHRHVYDVDLLGGDPHSCRCGAIQDPARSRRGKSSARLGKDQERRIERVYGPRKVGEFNLPIDHIGRLWKWQSKATRSTRPLWLAVITDITWRPWLPKFLEVPLAYATAYGEQTMGTVLIRSFVQQGLPTRDYLFCAANDWHDLKGGPNVDIPPVGYFVIEGHHWLDVVGRDQP